MVQNANYKVHIIMEDNIDITFDSASTPFPEGNFYICALPGEYNYPYESAKYFRKDLIKRMTVTPISKSTGNKT